MQRHKDNTLFGRIVKGIYTIVTLSLVVAGWVRGGEEERNEEPRDFLRTYTFGRVKARAMDEHTYIQHIRDEVIRLWERAGEEGWPMAVRIVVTCRFRKRVGGGKKYTLVHFDSLEEVVEEDTDLEELYDEMTQRILEKIWEFTDLGSGWEYDRIEYFEAKDEQF